MLSLDECHKEIQPYLINMINDLKVLGNGKFNYQ